MPEHLFDIPMFLGDEVELGIAREEIQLTHLAETGQQLPDVSATSLALIARGACAEFRQQVIGNLYGVIFPKELV